MLLGLLYEQQQQYSDAEHSFRRAESLWVLQQRLHNAVGAAQSADVVRDLLHAVYVHLARVLVAQRQYAKALEVIEVAHISVSDENATSDSSVAGGMVAAVKAQQKATASNLSLASVLSLKGLCTSLLGHSQKNAKRAGDGLAQCQRAIDLLIAAAQNCHPRQADAVKAALKLAVSVSARVSMTVGDWDRCRNTLLTVGYGIKSLRLSASHVFTCVLTCFTLQHYPLSCGFPPMGLAYLRSFAPTRVCRSHGMPCCSCRCRRCSLSLIGHDLLAS